MQATFRALGTLWDIPGTPTDVGHHRPADKPRQETEMKKQPKEKKSLKLNKETLRQLGDSNIKVAGGASALSGCPTCFPDICIELDSTGC